MSLEIKDILKFLSEFDGQKEAVIDSNLTDSLEDIEKSFNNLRSLLISTRVKKIMETFEQKSTDIYVQTMPKAGTTLVQMLLYQMTTNGDMSFKHLYDVSPWYGFAARGRLREFEKFLKNPPDVKRRKIIKSHDHYSMFKDLEKGKIVYVIRNGKDQLHSNFHQHKNYFEYKMQFENFVDSYIKDWFIINEEWLRNENQYPIIYINYEDIVLDKKTVILKLADFLEIPITNKIIERTIERTSFSFMKKHEKKFGEQPEIKEEMIYDQFIRKGKVGEGKKYFTKEQLEKYNELSKNYLDTCEFTKRYFKN